MNDLSPNRWANTLTTLLNAFYGSAPERFPVNVPTVAMEYSRQVFPEDPISMVAGHSLPGFDGALYKAPPGKKGWGIIYNSSIGSLGRINFTLAHEFGHYLLHRLQFPDGLECGQQDVMRWEREYRRIESQANEFAAGLLMPLDDFRRQIDGRAKPTLDALRSCAQRYNTSLIAVTLRWLQYTERRSVLVVSRDEFILWARSSERALKTGAFYRTVGKAPVSVPSRSLAAQPGSLDGGIGSIVHGENVWFAEPCEEIFLASDQYEFSLSLIHLEEYQWPRSNMIEIEEDSVDLVLRGQVFHRRR